MTNLKLAAILLVVVGASAMTYGRLSFTKDQRNRFFGPYSFTTSDQEVVNPPMWGAAGFVVLGALVLMSARQRQSN